jgi:hypothetical protein
MLVLTMLTCGLVGMLLLYEYPLRLNMHEAVSIHFFALVVKHRWYFPTTPFVKPNECKVGSINKNTCSFSITLDSHAVISLHLCRFEAVVV